MRGPRGNRGHAAVCEPRARDPSAGYFYRKCAADRRDVLIDALRELIAGEQVCSLWWRDENADDEFARREVLVLVAEIQTLERDAALARAEERRVGEECRSR